MLMLYFIYLTLILSMIFSWMMNPLTMGLLLLTQTIFISMISGMMIKTFWFSYILFLIFIGGLLVLFIYVSALASNELFSFSFKILSYFFIFTSPFLLFLYLSKFNLTFNNLNSFDTYPLTLNLSLIYDNNYLLQKLYNFPLNLIIILLMIYLLFTLIIIVKICNINIGPLRQKSYPN